MHATVCTAVHVPNMHETDGVTGQSISIVECLFLCYMHPLPCQLFLLCPSNTQTLYKGFLAHLAKWPMHLCNGEASVICLSLFVSLLELSLAFNLSLVCADAVKQWQQNLDRQATTPLIIWLRSWRVWIIWCVWHWCTNTVLTKATAVCMFHFNNPSADDANV